MELIRQLQKWKQGETIDSIWWDVYHWFIQQEHWHSRLKMGLQSLDYAYKEVHCLSKKQGTYMVRSS